MNTATLERDGLAIIHPSFLPSLTVANNDGPGIVALTESTSELGKADEGAAAGLNLKGLLIENNKGVGLTVSCGKVTLSQSVITGTQPSPALPSFTGIGLRGDRRRGLREPGNHPGDRFLHLVEGNSGAGIRVRSGARATVNGVIANNEGPGIEVSDANTELWMTDPVCAASADPNNADCQNAPRVLNNRVAGIYALEGTSVTLDGIIVRETRSRDGVNGPMGFGDGILANKPASFVAQRSWLDGNHRSGLLLRKETLSNGLAPSVTLTQLHVSNNTFGLMAIRPDAIADSYTLGTVLETPTFWSYMEGTCTFDGNGFDTSMLGCFPLPQANCRPIWARTVRCLNPAGNAESCSFDSSCTMDVCVEARPTRRAISTTKRSDAAPMMTAAGSMKSRSTPAPRPSVSPTNAKPFP